MFTASTLRLCLEKVLQLGKPYDWTFRYPLTFAGSLLQIIKLMLIEIARMTLFA